MEWLEGNYADYEAERKRRLGEDAGQPHRINYKRLNQTGATFCQVPTGRFFAWTVADYFLRI